MRFNVDEIYKWRIEKTGIIPLTYIKVEGYSILRMVECFALLAGCVVLHLGSGFSCLLKDGFVYEIEINRMVVVNMILMLLILMLIWLILMTIEY